MTLEDELRSALNAHAEKVEPSPDGLERIQARLDTVPAARPRLAPRLLVAAGLLIVVGALGATSLRSTGGGDIETTADTTLPVAEAAEVEDELPPLDDAAASDDAMASASSDPTVGDPSGFEFPAAPAGILGPKASTPELAVEGFLQLIQKGAEQVAVDFEGSVAVVSRVLENGERGIVTTLQLGSTTLADGSPGVVVIQAISPNIQIETPSMLSTTTGSTLTVSGQGEGFEATVLVDLYSSRDGVQLAGTWAMAGNFGVMGPFSADLPVSGPGPVWVVVQQAGGTDTELDPFAAVPALVDAPKADPEYFVTDIPADDPVGGLVVRNLPGVDGDELTVLPTGQGSIFKRAAFSATVSDGEPTYNETEVVPAEGEQEWWNVWLPEPLSDGRQWGWVNARYLGVADDQDQMALTDLGGQFVDGLQGNDEVFASLPWSEEGVVYGLSSDLRTASSSTAGSAEFWSRAFSFTPPEALSGTLDGSLREVLSPTKEPLAPETSVEVGVFGLDKASPYPGVNDALADRFPGAVIVKLTDPTNDGSGWRIVNLFVQPGEDGPSIVGMVAVEWTP